MKVKLKLDFIIHKREKDYTGLYNEFKSIIPEGTIFEVKEYNRKIKGITLISNTEDEISVSLEEFRTLFEEV